MASLTYPSINSCDGQINCPTCSGKAVKNGKSSGKQQYKCNQCSKRFVQSYTYEAYRVTTNENIISLVKEGCGIRSIARLLKISTTTVLSRIRHIAHQITLPAIPRGKDFEVDELRTFIKKKTQTVWVVIAYERSSKKVVSFNIGSRTNKTLKVVLDSLELASARKIYTDKLRNYAYLIERGIHQTKRYSTNQIERLNLNLRTHLKRLHRRSICYSKNIHLLKAVLKIYFWRHPNVSL